MTDTKLKDTIKSKVVKVDSKKYTIRPLTLNEMRPLFRKSLDDGTPLNDDIIVSAYVVSTIMDDFGTMEDILNGDTQSFGPIAEIAGQVSVMMGMNQDKEKK